MSVRNDITVGVEGLAETVRKMTKIGIDVKDIKKVMYEAGTIVRDEARRNAPGKRLPGSIRPGRGKNGVTILAGGGKKAWHFKFIEFGTVKIAARHPIYNAITTKQQSVVRVVDDGLKQLLREAHLT